MVRDAPSIVNALWDALDERRRSRGLAWAQVAREMGGVSASTLAGMRGRRSLEGDGVLQMLRWLGRSPESFLRDAASISTDATLPTPPPASILRFDSAVIHAALDARRVERGLTWRDVAAEIGGVGTASLTRLEAGGRVAFPEVVRIAQWLGQPVAGFVRVARR